MTHKNTCQQHPQDTGEETSLITKEKALSVLPYRETLMVGHYCPPVLFRQEQTREQVKQIIEECEMVSVTDKRTTKLGFGIALLHEEKMLFIQTAEMKWK